MKNILSALVVGFGLFLNSASASASVAPEAVSFDVANLEQEHAEFILSHHLAGSINPETAKREISWTPKGLPVSIILENGGISTYLKTKDGAVIHTFMKAHTVFMGIPDGVEIAFNVSLQESRVIEFHRAYALTELGTIKSDIQAVIKNLRSKEWRETTTTLLKMLLCAQVAKLPEMKRIPKRAVDFITKTLAPVCSGM